MTEPKGAPAPYAPLAGENFFELPCGQVAKMNDVVELNPVGSTVNQCIRYQEEVRLVQRALGVEPDGKFGFETRTAARDVAKRFKPEVVQAAFVKLWMEAFNLGTEARDAGLPECVHAVCAYLHNKLCIAHRDLLGEEHLDLDVSTKRPVFIPPAPKYSAERANPKVVMEPKVDLGAALQEIEIARMQKCLRWFAAHSPPGSDQEKTALEGLGNWTPPAKPTDEVAIKRWAIEDVLKQLPHVEVLRPIGLENYLKARLEGARYVGP